jgi:hypothetical protein
LPLSIENVIINDGRPALFEQLILASLQQFLRVFIYCASLLIGTTTISRGGVNSSSQQAAHVINTVVIQIQMKSETGKVRIQL